MTVTACGECCAGYGKKDSGICRGCIETEGHCEEWTPSGGCPIFWCAKAHSVPFCGLCAEFPCTFLREKIPWSPHVVEHRTKLAEIYRA